MGKDYPKLDFYVDILNTAAWSINSPIITGALLNFNKTVQRLEGTDEQLEAPVVSQPSLLTVVLAKKFKRTMDIGYVQFDVAGLVDMKEWGKEGRALV